MTAWLPHRTVSRETHLPIANLVSLPAGADIAVVAVALTAEPRASGGLRRRGGASTRTLNRRTSLMFHVKRSSDLLRPQHQSYLSIPT